MRTLLKAFVTDGLLISVSACVPRAVVINSNDDVVRLGPDVKGHVYVLKNGTWTKVGKVRLPEGWYAGPMPEE